MAPIIVFAQFCCTSLWFAGNGILQDLTTTFQLSSMALGNLTAAVQFGFIIGTLVFAALTIADRFSPSKVFFTCAVLGAFVNLGVLWDGNTEVSLSIIRMCTGFFLAGIYPVGMKIAADYFDKNLSKSLGFLVGALVLGTAFPHALQAFTQGVSWIWVIISTSSVAVLGGLLMVLFIPNGPYRKQSQEVNFKAFFSVFKNRNFKAAALGYFGHMWELYAFWAFIPWILKTYQETNSSILFDIPLWSFYCIAIGSVGCVLGGQWALKKGAKKVAVFALVLSGICCLLSPFVYQLPLIVFLGFLLIWGIAVITDSPLFSTLVAKHADPEVKGTALTIVNCIGFAITILSIQLVSFLERFIAPQYVLLVLVLGPIFGLYHVIKSRNLS